MRRSPSANPIMKKPKLEDIFASSESDGSQGSGTEEQEEALVALLEHRSKELRHNRQRLSYYQSQLEESEKKVRETESKLACLRRQKRSKLSPVPANCGAPHRKLVDKEHHPSDGTATDPSSRPQLLKPPASPMDTQPARSAEPAPKPYSHCLGGQMIKAEKKHRSPLNQTDVRIQRNDTSRKFEQKEHKELIPSIRTSSSPSLVQCCTYTHISSQHKRKMRSLALCPTNNQLFVTSALDGVVNLWQIQARGSSASLLSTTDCVSPKQRRWPEDIVWHPEGNSLFSVYTADGGDSQISVLNLNRTEEKSRVTFLEEKPHAKGIINGINFMPWEDICFVTGGSDHAVIFWNAKDGGGWKPKVLHKSLHSSAVMGVAGAQKKKIVLSVGADKKIIGFDVLAGRVDFKHQIESKCMSILPNPCDFHLYMVQTGTPGRQLRLFDIRLRKTEIHAFGWKQESSDSQSALINQSWSSDGYYITSGSADPMFHIFDIRYNAQNPSQSVQAHQKRVFKVSWHHSLPLLISISSDLNIGFHKIA
ncbi:hypothetical protein RJ641_008926 [Dillenia turbinata]|uniref:Uncharacterized protein n=1 Tax=Dillenia turbinata TaxID=194707 RepID=A0AAN8Z6T6_9MAGN